MRLLLRLFHRNVSLIALVTLTHTFTVVAKNRHGISCRSIASKAIKVT